MPTSVYAIGLTVDATLLKLLLVGKAYRHYAIRRPV